MKGQAEPIQNSARHPMINMIVASLGLGALALLSSSAQANGFGENTPWQFSTANDRIARANTVDLIERKKGGYYDSFQVNNTYNITNTTDINGDQINCYQQATTTGNSGSQLADGTSSSPTTGSQGDIGSSAVGNESVSDISGTRSATSSQYNLDASGQADQQASVNQDNLNSRQTSTVSNSNISSSVGAVYASGGRTDQVLNSSQTVRDSHLQASITGSTGCSFVRPTTSP